jgi:glyoxylase-like metal-dependent hydrolase (beta-lactamase superfamily II)
MQRLRGVGVQRVAAGVFQLHHTIPDILKAFYLASPSGNGGVLVDAGTLFCESRLLKQLNGLADVLQSDNTDVHKLLAVHALTHVHPDHNGASAAICEKYRIPLWVGEADADVAEGRAPLTIGPSWSPLFKLPHQWWSGRSHSVARRTADGDALLDSGFSAVASPGHTAGHFGFWRETDRVLICGDALANFRFTPSADFPGFSLPPRLFNADQAEMRRSVTRLAALRPRTMLFGHGQPFDNSQSEFERFADSLL